MWMPLWSVTVCAMRWPNSSALMRTWRRRENSSAWILLNSTCSSTRLRNIWSNCGNAMRQRCNIAMTGQDYLLTVGIHSIWRHCVQCGLCVGFLPEASIGLRVLPLPPSVRPSVCPSVTKFVRAITQHLFKLGSPNLDRRCKRPWLRSLLFFGVIDLDLQGQILL